MVLELGARKTFKLSSSNPLGYLLNSTDRVHKNIKKYNEHIREKKPYEKALVIT